MRQKLSDKKVRTLATRLGLPIVHVLVRGDTEHRQDLCLQDGTVLHYWPKTGQTEKASTGWAVPANQPTAPTPRR